MAEPTASQDTAAGQTLGGHAWCVVRPVPVLPAEEWIAANDRPGPVTCAAPWRGKRQKPLPAEPKVPLQPCAPVNIDPAQMELTDIEDEDALDAATARSTEWPLAQTGHKEQA